MHHVHAKQHSGHQEGPQEVTLQPSLQLPFPPTPLLASPIFIVHPWECRNTCRIAQVV
jgi:hypothetical protein